MASWPAWARPNIRSDTSSPEVMRMVVMRYVRYPLSPRTVEDITFERGYETVMKKTLKRHGKAEKIVTDGLKPRPPRVRAEMRSVAEPGFRSVSCEVKPFEFKSEQLIRLQNTLGELTGARTDIAARLNFIAAQPLRW